jgi:lipopolysaccharide export system protein LptA
LKFTIGIILFFFFLICGVSVSAQQVIVPSPTSDTVRVIRIVQGNNLRMKTIDASTVLETIAGNVIIKEGLTTFYCDSATINRKTNIVEAFGNIHINDNDSIHTYAQYLKYVGNERMAYLKKNVRLTDKKGVLLTDELEYNLATGIATYKNGGKITNQGTVLTSREGVYYSDTKDVYFKRNVHLVDPERNIWADSLLYNIKTNIATFISPTQIVGKDGSVINTKSGTYNLVTGEAAFFERSSFSDSSYSGVADRIASDKKTGKIQMEGNAKLVDSANKVIILGNQIFIDTKLNAFLATRKPVMIFYKDNDSTYIAADTLFSGLRKYDSTERRIITQIDTLKTTVIVTDSAEKPLFVYDTLTNELVATDTIAEPVIVADSLATTVPAKDTARTAMVVNLNSADTTIRYFLAFHHVRIFNDSLQAVSDSLHYSTSDSTFKLFGEPVVWNDKSQITGDTIYMYTENRKPKRLYVFFNGMVINKTSEGLYNQIAGRTLNGYFIDGNIDYVRVKGSPAESIFYPQDDDSAYVGMNRSSGDVIDIYFVKKELNKVKFVNNVDGTMYPMKQIPADKKELKGFKWLDNRRPKNKLELFE